MMRRYRLSTCDGLQTVIRFKSYHIRRQQGWPVTERGKREGEGEVIRVADTAARACQNSPIPFSGFRFCFVCLFLTLRQWVCFYSPSVACRRLVLMESRLEGRINVTFNVFMLMLYVHAVILSLLTFEMHFLRRFEITLHRNS